MSIIEILNLSVEKILWIKYYIFSLKLMFRDNVIGSLKSATKYIAQNSSNLEAKVKNCYQLTLELEMHYSVQWSQNIWQVLTKPQTAYRYKHTKACAFDKFWKW